MVLAIIGLVLALSLPHFGHMNQGRVMDAALRQLLDDLAFARQSAIASRSTVAVVFIPPDILNASYVNPFAPGYDAQEQTNLLTLQAGGLTTYALFGFRHVGDQPGAAQPRYLTDWRSLPEKTFLAAWAFTNFYTNSFPFPLARSTRRTSLPYVAFNSQGQCLPVLNANGLTTARTVPPPNDLLLSLGNGTIMYTRDSNTHAVVSWNVQEIPPNNSLNVSNAIHINWLTGRATLVRSDLVKP